MWNDVIYEYWDDEELVYDHLYWSRHIRIVSIQVLHYQILAALRIIIVRIRVEVITKSIFEEFAGCIWCFSFWFWFSFIRCLNGYLKLRKMSGSVSNCESWNDSNSKCVFRTGISINIHRFYLERKRNNAIVKCFDNILRLWVSVTIV